MTESSPPGTPNPPLSSNRPTTPSPRRPGSREQALGVLLMVIGVGLVGLSGWFFLTTYWADPNYLMQAQRARSRHVLEWNPLVPNMEAVRVKREELEAHVLANVPKYCWWQFGYGCFALLVGVSAFSAGLLRYSGYMDDRPN